MDRGVGEVADFEGEVGEGFEGEVLIGNIISMLVVTWFGERWHEDVEPL